MEALQSRIDSFVRSKRVKTSSKSSKSALKWPHPLTFKASPEALAEAGFYYTPSVEDRDSVTCFECGKQLSEWEESDDPFDLHWTKCGDKCCWAAVRCGLRGDMDNHGRFTFPDKTRLPGSKRMEKARLGTFAVGDGWMHDQGKNHGANSRKMAQAGFVWTPQLPGDDLATCLYCNISLSGWEKGDDPMEEHHKRVKPGTICAFFAHNPASGMNAQTPSIMSAASTATASPTTHRLTRSTSAKPPSRAQSKPSRPVSSSRLTRGHQDITQPVKDFDGSGYDALDKSVRKQDEDDLFDEEPAVRPVEEPTATGRTRKSSRAPSLQPSTRHLTRTTAQPVVKKAKSKVLKDVEEEEEEIVEGAAEPPSRRISKEEVEEVRPAQTKSRTSRKPTKTRGKSIARKKRPNNTKIEDKLSLPLDDDEEETAAGVAEPLSRHVPEEEVEVKEVCPAPTKSRTSRRPTKTREKSVSHKKHSNDPDVEEKISLPLNEEVEKAAEGTAEPPSCHVSEGEAEEVRPASTISCSSNRPPTTPPCIPEKQCASALESTAKAPSPDPTTKMPEPQILPALSRIPFMPLQILVDAELDMTVEEWIRYQMEIEFDKLKRDGERELAQFRVRAEEVRKVIEEL